ncbi:MULTISPECIES: enoyl-CoA hydratase/isomerase family protein [Nocardioides]|uniref:3-hydroxyisobutyryl-CoA hydrolase n=1 Tax=Nocardioides vastitatis TaxID=2568655 RepID=A0ABW0ZL49_9ACTN|nr:enoyl-CoA hydratase/isomerase family protein [Nocardioides sp.]THJ05722.1 enoyl-CoA hydratase/isomerase family protein [Nocardioides sp.]
MAETGILLDGVRVRVGSGIGRITLDRPGALNALTTPMVRAIDDTLAAWSGQGGVVLIDSSSPKAFCAGGDIRAIRENTLAGDLSASESFFATEYAMNARVAAYEAPIVSFIDGICMGGGMGLSIHGAFRLVTDRAVLAMPETAIGFFPDVGASYFLSRLPGSIGIYLGLTGHRIDAADALCTGLATHFAADLTADQVADALANSRHEPVDHVLSRLVTRTPVGESRIAMHRGEIDWCFTARDVEEIKGRLRRSNTAWSRSTLDELEAVSVQSLDVTLALLRWARQHTLRDCLGAELELARRITLTDDFVEGVRAALVDKDRQPVWGRSRFGGLDSAGRARWTDHADNSPREMSMR